MMKMKQLSLAVLCLMLVLPVMAKAKAKPVPAKNPVQPVYVESVVTPEGKSPFVEVVKRIRAAVVQIKVEAKITVQQWQNPFGDDPFFKFFNPPQPQSQRPYTAMGSGFIYEFNTDTREAFLITNNHVVEKGKDGTITVTLADKVAVTGTIVGTDPNTDLAVVKIKVDNDEQVTVAPLGDSDKLDIGDWAIAIGNPFDDGLDRTVTVGVISAVGRANLNFGEGSPQYQDYIQTDAAINPGNSGGPLINIKGEVIGINAAITSTSGGNIGIGFAIPINLAKRVVEDLVTKGKVTRAYMGIEPDEITSDMKEYFNLKEVAGIIVKKVNKDTPADKAGLKKDDIIIEFNGEKVSNVSKFRIAVATAKVDQEVPVKIIRDGKEMTLKVKLEEYPEDIVALGKEKDSKGSQASGLSVEANDSQFAKRLGIDSNKGVVVNQIESDSPAAKAGLSVGDIILEVERNEVNTPAEFYKALSDARDKLDKSGKTGILLYVMDRNKSGKYVILKLK